VKVLVAINAKDKNDFLNQLKASREIFLPKTKFHIDVSDGKFSQTKSYFDFGVLKKYHPYFNFEAHLMTEAQTIKKYLKKPLKKIWVHISAVRDWSSLMKVARIKKISMGVVLGVGEEKYKNKIPSDIKSILVLAVNPGPAGQKFNSKTFKLIDFLRKNYPHAKISVDGGINRQIAEKLKKYQVDSVVSFSYIWKSKNPLKAYQELVKI